MTASLGRKTVLFLVLVLAASSLFALDINKLPPDNWSAPATFSPMKARGGLSAMDVTSPLPFIAVAPCRIADTRVGFGFGGAYGPPSLAAGSPRSFTLTGQCGIPAAARVVSLNVTVTNTQGPGFILIYPTGGVQPNVSTVNYVAGQTIANAAIVPTGGGAVTVVAGVSGTDLILDTNGYYPESSQVNRIASGEFFGIYGTFGGGGVNFGENNSGSGFSIGVRGRTTGSGTDSAGVEGEATATTGLARGVLGITSSNMNENAGVLGRTPAPFTPEANFWNAAGVRGEGDIGVLGLVGTGSPNNFAGVIGGQVTSAGTNAGGWGLLGYPFANKAVFAVGDFLASGAKSFGDPHPTDPTKMIDYVSLEGPESGTYFRGTAEIVRGQAIISVPEHFRLVTDPEDLSVQLTPIGAYASMYIVSEDLNQIVVRSNRDVRFHYLVQGVRATLKDHQPIADSIFVPFSPDSMLPNAFTPEQRRRLIANGTYNPDGTVNMETARAVGWAKVWEDAAKARQAAAQASSNRMKSDPQAGEK